MYKALISYEGTHYFGWQKTIAGPSIQEVIEKKLLQITQESTLLLAASRTDRGVHAMGQVIQFSLKNTWNPEALKFALNAHLPKDIRILELIKKDFHPTLDALWKEYQYKITLAQVQDPHDRFYSWHAYYPLEIDQIHKGAQELLGTHDFTAFSNQSTEDEDNPICSLQKLEFDGSLFKIRGDRFLYKMVRNLIGSLVYYAAGKLTLGMKELLASKDRKLGGITAPAHGLYLHEVEYPIK